MADETNDHEMSEEQNGDAMETDSKSKELADYGLNESVMTKLEELFTTGKLTFSELDERVLEMLKEFPVDGALTVLKEFMDSNLEHVSNKSAYLYDIMNNYHQKTKMEIQDAKGSDEEKIKAISAGYTLDVTTGQRNYSGPPPNWEGNPPGSGCQDKIMESSGSSIANAGQVPEGFLSEICFLPQIIDIQSLFNSLNYGQVGDNTTGADIEVIKLDSEDDDCLIVADFKRDENKLNGDKEDDKAKKDKKSAKPTSSFEHKVSEANKVQDKVEENEECENKQSSEAAINNIVAQANKFPFVIKVFSEALTALATEEAEDKLDFVIKFMNQKKYQHAAKDFV